MWSLACDLCSAMLTDKNGVNVCASLEDLKALAVGAGWSVEFRDWARPYPEMWALCPKHCSHE